MDGLSASTLRPRLEIPGVHAIITAADVGEQIPTIPIRLAPIAGLEKYLQPVIAREKVRYVGEPIAVILAESRAIAEDAANAIDLAIDSARSNSQLANRRNR